jgi:hypothetical protein
MAQRRMFSLKVIDTDQFLDMPQSSQFLYYNLAMRADDDGFVGNPKKIMRMIGCNDDDIKILIAKKFVIPFETGVCVIRHWRIHNYIQSDRYEKTQFTTESNLITDVPNGTHKSYALLDEIECIQNVSKMETQDRLELGKDRIGEVKDICHFERWWKIYPNKELKKKTQEIWDKKKLDIKVDIIIDFTEKAKLTDRWKKGFIKQPTTFLNNECWNDDIKSYGSATQNTIYKNQEDNTASKLTKKLHEIQDSNNR